MTKDEALKLGLQLVETAEYLATDSAVCGNYVKEERALIQQSKIAFEKALAQPEQKPVAWMREDEDCTDCIVWEQTEEHTIPLYTTPPKREWVGLTDEEKHDCYLRIDIWSRCVEMVEAKLREKNGG